MKKAVSRAVMELPTKAQLRKLRVVSLRNKLQAVGLAQSGGDARFSSVSTKERFPRGWKRLGHESPAKIASPSVSLPTPLFFLPAGNKEELIARLRQYNIEQVGAR